MIKKTKTGKYAVITFNKNGSTQIHGAFNSKAAAEERLKQVESRKKK